MNPLSFFSPYKIIIEAVVIGAVILGIGIGVHKFLAHEQSIGYDKAVGEYNVKLIAAQAAAHDKEVEYKRQIQEAQNAAALREKTIVSVAAAAAATSASLRDTIANISRGVPTATIDALRQSTRVLGNVFAECQDRRRERVSGWR